MQILLVLALVFASFVAVFALQNAQTVPIRFFAWERETSIAVIVLAAAAVGALSAVLAGLVRQLRSGLRYRQLKSELARTRKELDDVRAAKQSGQAIALTADDKDIEQPEMDDGAENEQGGAADVPKRPSEQMEATHSPEAERQSNAGSGAPPGSDDDRSAGADSTAVDENTPERSQK